MIGLLEDLLSVLEDIGAYFLTGLVDFLNAIESLIEALVNVFLLLLPSMSEIGGRALATPFAPPEQVAMVNKIMPLGFLVSVITPCLAVFVVWLAGSFILRKAGIIE